MKIYRCNSHAIVRFICLFICVVGIVVIGYCYNKLQKTSKIELENVILNAKGDAIIIKWNSPNWYICDYVTVQIEDDNGIVYEKNVWPIIQKISYKNGEHGKTYTVSVSAHYRDGSFGENIKKRTLFWDYDCLPNLPLIIINTYSGEDPTHDEAEIPDDDLWGATIVDNEYISGEMVISGGGIKNVSAGLDIRVRGNTSTLQSKKSYKIRLDDAYDLLDRNKGYSCREWVLLNNGIELKTYLGNYIGTLCEMEWQPEMMFVNVILNGDWKGCYCLTEAVCRESSYGLVSETGYIFENDAYWWNSEDLYFKTNRQIYALGYTFKYPEIVSKDETAVLMLQNYMQDFEDKIYSGDISYQNYIDEKSYSSWILARDILGNTDAGGSNMYFYKYDFDEDDHTSTKVKMGPLWDFDGAFYMVNEWSTCRQGHVSYFPQLFEQETFSGMYRETWARISPYLYDNIKALLDDLEEAYGKDIEASWLLESTRWGSEIESFDVQKEKALEWFFKRIIWMNNSLQIPALETTAIDISGYTHVKNSIACQIDAQYTTDEATYLEGWAFIADMADNAEYGEIGILANQKVFLANESNRTDIQDAYSLSSDQIGFYIYKGFDGGTLCIIDEENKIIYE